MKIVILDGYTANPGDLSWSGFEALGELSVYDNTPADKVVERIGDADVVITNKVPITADILAACPSIKYVGVKATGYNQVDTDAAKARGIPVTNIPSYSTDAVAQLTIALLLEICHHVGHHDHVVKKGKWQGSEGFCFWDFPLLLLTGKTFGVIGFGKIGQATAHVAKALGMNIIAYDGAPTEEGKKLAEYVSLDELLKRSDIISLHCPLFPETEGIINKTSISKMKDGVILLNTSRGPLLVEQDVADALKSGKIYAAGVDVVSVEPIRTDNPLLKAENIFITPHIAWAPKESRKRLLDIAVENIKAFTAGKPENVVNAPH